MGITPASVVLDAVVLTPSVAQHDLPSVASDAIVVVLAPQASPLVTKEAVVAVASHDLPSVASDAIVVLAPQASPAFAIEAVVADVLAPQASPLVVNAA